jgi:hypothetical protein
MAITITSNIQSAAVSAPSTPASGIVLQAGQVITAEVLQVLGNDQVQIAIGNQTIEASTQVPLQVGQTLQLQVSQTPGGIGLSIVNQPSAAPGQAVQASEGAGATSDPVLTLSPSLAASLAANLTTDAVTPSNPLTPLETLAVAVAAQTAVTQQASLAPLFADLGVAAGLPNLPPQVQQAVAQVLAQQIPLDQNLTADAVQQAFQSSGLFLENSLASGSALASSVPDLKAALLVLRQTLTSALSEGGTTVTTTTAGTAAPASASALQPASSQASAATEAAPSSTATPSEPATSGAVATPVSVSPSASTPQQGAALTAAVLAVADELIAGADAVPAAAATELVPSEALFSAASAALPTATTAPTASAQGSATAVAQEILELAAGSATLAPTAVPTDAAMRAAATSAALNLLQESVQFTPLTAVSLSRLLTENGQALALLPVVTGTRPAAIDDPDFARTNLPPPPVNGALPAAQPVAPATLASHMPLNTALAHLLDDTDGAIARQTLLQIASLPGQADPSTSRVDTSPRWNFEVPFATPQGTAMAQFEISRDGGGREASAAKVVWRARFSLNVEPAGPVHAMVSLNGDRTSVRMWAERPATASQLRAGVSQLTQALSRAELTPGDIVVRDGAPPQPPAAPAGHFLDRAS